MPPLFSIITQAQRSIETAALNKITLVAADNRITNTLIDCLYEARVITAIIVYTPAIMQAEWHFAWDTLPVLSALSCNGYGAVTGVDEKICNNSASNSSVTENSAQPTSERWIGYDCSFFIAVKVYQRRRQVIGTFSYLRLDTVATIIAINNNFDKRKPSRTGSDGEVTHIAERKICFYRRDIRFAYNTMDA